jgi:hypothetical protein
VERVKGSSKLGRKEGSVGHGRRYRVSCVWEEGKRLLCVGEGKGLLCTRGGKSGWVRKDGKNQLCVGKRKSGLIWGREKIRYERKNIDTSVCWKRKRISLYARKGEGTTCKVEEGIACISEEGSREGISSCVKESWTETKKITIKKF